MILPAVATLAACASFITAAKSTWELSRMVRRKQIEHAANTAGACAVRRLRIAHRNDLINDREYDKWYEIIMLAIVRRDRESLLLLYRISLQEQGIL